MCCIVVQLFNEGHYMDELTAVRFVRSVHTMRYQVTALIHRYALPISAFELAQRADRVRWRLKQGNV